MSRADDFMNKLDAYIAACLREHKSGLRAAHLNVAALERLISETPRRAVDPERQQHNPAHR